MSDEYILELIRQMLEGKKLNQNQLDAIREWIRGRLSEGSKKAFTSDATKPAPKANDLGKAAQAPAAVPQEGPPSPLDRPHISCDHVAGRHEPRPPAHLRRPGRLGHRYHAGSPLRQGAVLRAQGGSRRCTGRAGEAVQRGGHRLHGPGVPHLWQRCVRQYGRHQQLPPVLRRRSCRRLPVLVPVTPVAARAAWEERHHI
jgi:hypothetical protein